MESKQFLEQLQAVIGIKEKLNKVYMNHLKNNAQKPFAYGLHALWSTNENIISFPEEVVMDMFIILFLLEIGRFLLRTGSKLIWFISCGPYYID